MNHNNVWFTSRHGDCIEVTKREDRVTIEQTLNGETHVIDMPAVIAGDIANYLKAIL